MCHAVFRQVVRNGGGERAHRGAECANEGIAGKEGGARIALRGFGQARMFQRQEDTDIAGAWVHRADEGNEQERPEVRETGEQQAGAAHQPGGGEQQLALRITAPPLAHRQRHQRRAEQRRRADQPDVPHAQTERQQVDGQQNGDIAVGEGPQRATDQEPPRLGGDTSGQEHDYFPATFPPAAFQSSMPPSMKQALSPSAWSASTTPFETEPPRTQ